MTIRTTIWNSSKFMTYVQSLWNEAQHICELLPCTKVLETTFLGKLPVIGQPISHPVSFSGRLAGTVSTLAATRRTCKGCTTSWKSGGWLRRSVWSPLPNLRGCCNRAGPSWSPTKHSSWHSWRPKETSQWKSINRMSSRTSL